MSRPRAPLQPPPFTHDEVPPGWPAGLPPPIFCRGRGEPVTIFLPLSATANRPPPPGGVPIQLKRQWMMLLGLPEHVAADDALLERAIDKFAALAGVDRSRAPVVDGVTRVVLEALIADVKEVPRVLTVTFDDDPFRREHDVDVVLLRHAAEGGGQDGAGDAANGGATEENEKRFLEATREMVTRLKLRASQGSRERSSS